MAKATVRNLLAQTCRVTGLLGNKERSVRSQLTILCYHRILPAAEKATYFCPDLVVTPTAFRNHCQTLAEHYQVLPLHEAADALHSGEHDKPLVALTFDDGYVDNLRYAVPILAEFQQRATFFIVSGLVDTITPPWYDLVARCVSDLAMRGEGSLQDGQPTDSLHGLGSIELVEGAKALTPTRRLELASTLVQRLGGMPDFCAEDLVMNSSQLRELSAHGHEVGSHSVSHEILPLLDADSLAQEIRLSKEQLEKVIGKSITSFCYPNGDFDQRAIELMASCDYEQAVTTQSGNNSRNENPYTLRRRFVHEGRLADGQGNPSSALFRSEVSGLSDKVLRRGGDAS